jgi:hypothetical protein
MSESLESGDVEDLLRSLRQEYESWIAGEFEWERRCAERRRLREIEKSVRWRIDACRFHVQLLQQWHDAYDTSLQPSSSRREDRYILQRGAEENGFLFDDIIFNAASLFDYLACLAVQTLVGSQESDTIWRKAEGKIKSRANNRSLEWLEAYSEADKRLASRLIRYRSEVIHFWSDDPTGSIERDLLEGEAKLKIGQPEKFSQRKILGAEYTGIPLPKAGFRIYRQLLGLASKLLKALVLDIKNAPFSSPAANHIQKVNRWIFRGLLYELDEDDRLVRLGVERVTAALSEVGFTPEVVFQDGTRVSGPLIKPDELAGLSDESTPVEYVVERIAAFLNDPSLADGEDS